MITEIAAGLVIAPQMVPIDEEIRAGGLRGGQGPWVVHDLVDHDVGIEGVAVGVAEGRSVRVEPAPIGESPQAVGDLAGVGQGVSAGSEKRKAVTVGDGEGGRDGQVIARLKQTTRDLLGGAA